MEDFLTKQIPDGLDGKAPDGSEIRLLTRTKRGNTVHFLIQSGFTSKATTHKTIDELWFFINGKGEVWRKNTDNGLEEITAVKPGISISNPLGTHFQFRNTGKENLNFIIVAIPPRPGDYEAMEVKGKWQSFYIINRIFKCNPD